MEEYVALVVGVGSRRYDYLPGIVERISFHGLIDLIYLLDPTNLSLLSIGVVDDSRVTHTYTVFMVMLTMCLR